MTPDAKQHLARTIRDLRPRLLDAVRDEAERRYRVSVAERDAELDEAGRCRRERLERWLDERARGVVPAERTAERTRLLRQAEPRRRS